MENNKLIINSKDLVNSREEFLKETKERAIKECIKELMTKIDEVNNLGYDGITYSALRCHNYNTGVISGALDEFKNNGYELLSVKTYVEHHEDKNTGKMIYKQLDDEEFVWWGKSPDTNYVILYDSNSLWDRFEGRKIYTGNSRCKFDRNLPKEYQGILG